MEYGYLDGSYDITATGPDARQPFEAEYPAATRMYNITSEPLVHTHNRSNPVACGSVVGGSSAVNGMFFDRGSAEDYDSWVWAAGPDHEDEYAREWGWDNIYPFFRKSVTFHPPDERMQEEYGMTYDLDAWGGDTPVHASFAPFQWPGTVAVWDAWRTIEGVEFPKEHGDGNATGLIWCPNSIDPTDRTRSYSRRGHFNNGANERTNFHLLPAHRVTKVVLEEAAGDEDRAYRAAGVHIAPRDGEMFEDGPVLVKARREVVVSAGSVHTPQVLQRSGIGPTDILEAAGVEVKVELPGVGFNLQDHNHFTISFNCECLNLPLSKRETKTAANHSCVKSPRISRQTLPPSSATPSSSKKQMPSGQRTSRALTPPTSTAAPSCPSLSSPTAPRRSLRPSLPKTPPSSFRRTPTRL